MANQSDAYGTVIISTEHKEDLKDFIYLQLLSEKGANYPTTLLEVFDYGRINKEKNFNILEPLITKDKNKYQVTLKIRGIGYWSFKHNIEWFFKKPLTENYKNKTINNIRDRLQNRTLQAVFDFVDAEASSNYIVKAIYKIESVNNNYELTKIKGDYHGYNAKNLMYFNYYDIAVDREYALGHLDKLKNEMKKRNIDKEILSDDDKLRKAISELDNTIHTDYTSFIDEVIERM